MVELKGRDLAELRNKEIKEMLLKLESKRDALYDEIANRKGRAELVEEVITEIYNRIIDVNKEVQQQELREGVAKKAAEEEEKKKQKEREDFRKASRGIKTPKPKRPKRKTKSKEKVR